MASNLLNIIDETVLNLFGIQLSPQTRRVMSAFALGAFAILIGMGLWWVYAGYSGQKEKDAQKTLASCIELYDQAASANANSIPWSTVETACKRAHEEYANSAIAPYFLGYQAEALLKQNKIEEAITVMTAMMNSMFKSSPLYYIYGTKLALVQMDSADSAVHAQGLKRLEDLAADTNNEQRDEALYYAGLYYWQHNDTAKAKEAWQALAGISSPDEGASSPWMQLVASRLTVLA